MNKFYITEKLYGELCNTLNDFEHSTDNPDDVDYLSDGEWLDVFVNLSRAMEFEMRKQLPNRDTDKTEIMDLANRLYNLVDPWDRDYETVDDIANDIENDPDAVIEYLLDLLEG